MQRRVRNFCTQSTHFKYVLLIKYLQRTIFDKSMSDRVKMGITDKFNRLISRSMQS